MSGILSTIGSLATSAIKAAPAITQVVKAINKAPAKSGGSVVSKAPSTKAKAPIIKPIPLDNSGQLFEPGVVRTGSQGQTIDTTEKGYTLGVDAEAKSKAEDVIAGADSYELRKAREFDSSMKGNGLTLESTINDVKLAYQKAKSDTNAITNPSSPIAKAMAKNIGQDKYNLYKDIVGEYTVLKAAIKEDPTYANLTRGIEGIQTLPGIKQIKNLMTPTGEGFSTYLEAKQDAIAEGAGVIEDWTTPTANFLGSAIQFGALSSVGRLGAIDGLAALGTRVGGRTGTALLKTASNVETLALRNPTIYAMTVDNALVTSVQYGVESSLGDKDSGTNALNNIILNAAIPVVFKGAEAGLSKIQGVFSHVTPRDVSNLDKALAKAKESGATSNNSAINMVADDFYFSNGTSLRENIKKYKEANPAKANFDKTLSHEEVRATLASQDKAVSARGAKIVSSTLNKLNELITGDITPGTGYGELPKDTNIQLAKQAIIDNISGESVVNEKVATAAVKKALEDNGIKDITLPKPDSEDALDEVFHNPLSTPEKITPDTSPEEIGKLLTGEDSKTVTKKEVGELRYRNLSGELKPSELQEAAGKYGIKVNENKLYDKSEGGILSTEPKINKDYVTQIIDDIKVKRTGYSSTKSSILGEFRSKVNLAKKNALSVLEATTGKNFKSKFLRSEDGIGVGKVDMNKFSLRDIDEITSHALSETQVKGTVVNQEILGVRKLFTQLSKEASSLSNRIRNVATKGEKEKLIKLRDKKNLQIKNIKEKYGDRLDAKNDKISTLRTKAKEVVSFTRYVKDSIDMAGGKYPMVDKSIVSSIKNKYKSLINPNTTVDKAISIMERMDKELYIKAFDTLESKSSILLQRVLKANNTKSKKALVPVESLHKIIEAFSKLQEAKPQYNAEGTLVREGDLIKMVEANKDLATFYKEGRDIFKENIANSKEAIKGSVARLVDELGPNGMLEMRTVNTPVGGTRKKTWIQKIKEFAESNVPAYLQIERIFKGNKEMFEIFMGKFQKIQNKFTAKRREVLDIHGVNVVKKAAKIFSGNDDASYKLTFWFSKNMETARLNDRLTNVTFEKNKKGDWEVVFTRDPKKYIEVNSDKVSNGELIHFATSKDDVLKDKILDEVYAKLDDLYAKDKSFKAEVDYIRSHLSETGDEIADVSKRVFNKDFEKLQDYFPTIKIGKGGNEAAFDELGEFSTHVKDTVEDGFLNKKVAPGQGQMIERELGFIETLTYHMESAVWWKDNIESLLEADATFRKMKQGRQGVLDDEVSLLTEEDMFDLAKFGENNIDSVDSFSNPIMSDEVSFFLRTHIGKIATRGRNLNSGTSFSRGFINEAVAISNRLMLSGPKTALKQTMSTFDIPVHAGEANFFTGMRSANNSNILMALEDSGYLMERQATFRSKEGTAKAFNVSSDLTRGGKIYKGWGEATDFITGNTMKLVDGGVSARAYLSGVSKYLDEYHPEIHKAGRKLDLADVRKKLTIEEYENMVAYANNIMNKVMGSNQLVEKAIGSGDSISKLSLLFQRTGLNHLVATWDSVGNLIREGKIKGVGRTKLAALGTIALARVTLASALIYADARAIELGWEYAKLGMGMVNKEDMFQVRDIWGNPIEDPTYEDIIRSEMMFYLKTNIINPNTELDLATGFGPAITQLKKAAEAPTWGRATEEGINAIGKLAMNGSYSDMIRYGFSTMGVGRTVAEAKEYDKAYKYLEESLGMKPTEEQIKKQIEIDESRMRSSGPKEELAKIKEKFIKGAVSKYGKDLTSAQYIEYVNDNKSDFDKLGISTQAQSKSLLTAMQLAGKKSTGEVDSVLMSKDMETIFDVQIVPLLKEGKRDEAWKEVLRLDGKGVIKSGAGRKKILELFQSYKGQ